MFRNVFWQNLSLFCVLWWLRYLPKMDVFLPRAVQIPWKIKILFCSYKYVFVETVDKMKSGSEACFRIYSLAFGSEERIYQSFMHQKGTVHVEGCFNWQHLISLFFLLTSVNSFKCMNSKQPSASETCPAQQLRKSEYRELKPDLNTSDFNILAQDDWPSKTISLWTGRE